MLFKKYNPGACDEVCSSAVCLRSQSNSAWQPENILHLALFPILSAPSAKESQPTGETAARTAVRRRGDGRPVTRRRGYGGGEVVAAAMSLHASALRVFTLDGLPCVR